MSKLTTLAPYKKWCALITLPAVLLRVLFVHGVVNEQVFDFKTYYELAVNVARGLGHTLNGQPIAWTPPAYPYALGLFFALTGNMSELNGKYFNIICSLVTMVFFFFILDKLFTRKRMVTVAYGVLCFFPHYIAYTNVLGTEVFFTMLLAATLFVNLYAGERRAAHVITGVLVGLLALTKPTMLVYPTVLAGILWIRHKKLKQTLAYAGVVTACMLLTILPWTVRNVKSYDRFIFLTYNMGYNMYVNNNGQNLTGSWMDISRVPKTPEVEAEINRYLRDGARSIKEAYDIEPLLKSEAVKWIKQNPVQYVNLCLLRFYSTFFHGAEDVVQWSLNKITLYPDGEQRGPSGLRAVNGLFALLNITATVFNVSGLLYALLMFPRYCRSFFSAKASRVSERVSVTFLHIAFFVVVYFFFEGQPRYAYPVYPFMMIAWVASCEKIWLED